VGPTAEVLAELDVKSVVIDGRVVGNVTASECLEILATGSLEGNIRTSKIVIAEGAQFKGSVDMGGKPGPAAEPTPPKNPPAGSPAR
jgi:cytoskeletal protein CcmA (bactofilin family)